MDIDCAEGNTFLGDTGGRIPSVSEMSQQIRDNGIVKCCFIDQVTWNSWAIKLLVYTHHVPSRLIL